MQMNLFNHQNEYTYSDYTEYILEEMRRVYQNDKRPWIIGYSGGKDSSLVVYLTFIMLSRLDKSLRHKHVYVVSSDTLIENPLILAHLKKNIDWINDAATEQELNLSAHMVHPEYNNTFWVNIIGKGLPTPKSMKFRWCTERLKIYPSNKFIEERVSENGEVVVILGVRKAESQVRKMRIENRQIEGYLLVPHSTLRNTYVFNPIVDLTTDDVWSILLSNGARSPWNGDNNYLFKLYTDSDGGECPFTVAEKTGETPMPSCGQTRFGCWTCTVVKKDKSLQGFIDSGEEWLIPLVEFREWLLQIRDNKKYREIRKRNGSIYKVRIAITEAERKDLPLGSIVQKDEKGLFIIKPGFGPFNMYARKLILEKLLRLEDEIGLPLILEEELREIEKIWDKEEDLSRRQLVDLYSDVKKTRLPWDKFKKPMFDETILNILNSHISKFDVDPKLMTDLVISTYSNKHLVNKTKYRKDIDRIFNQEYLHEQYFEELDYEN